ncbi:MAG: PAS domain S-box protein [Acidobacteriota bacterium]
MADSRHGPSAENDPPHPSGQELWRTGLVSAALLALAYAAALLLTSGRGWFAAVDGAVIVLVPLAAAAVMFLCSRRLWSASPRAASAWLLLGVAYLSAATGDLFTALGAGYGQGVPAYLHNGFFLLFYPLFFAGALRLPRAPLSRAERGKVFVDVAVVVATAGMLLWALLLGPALAGDGKSPLLVFSAVAYPLGDLALLWALLSLVFSRKERFAVGIYGLLAGSMALLILSDTLWSSRLAEPFGWITPWLGFGWFLSYLLAGLAGLRQLSVLGREGPAGPAPPLVRPSWVSFYLAYLFLIGVMAALMLRHPKTFSPLILAAIGILVAFTLVRQVMGAAENEVLTRRLQAARNDLERRVYERTIELEQAIGQIETEMEERSQAQEALAASEERFRALVQNAHDIITIHAPSGRILYESPSAARIMGYGPGGMLDRNPFELVHPDDLPILRDAFGRLNSRTELGVPREYRFRHADGRWVHLESLGANLLDSPAVQGIVMTTRDVTERRQAQEELAASEERFRRLSEATFEGIGITENGRVLDANRQLAEMLGYGLEEMIGREVTEFVAPEHAEGVIESIRSGRTGLYEHTARRKDGSLLYVETQGRNITYKGRLVRVSVVRDVTERRRAEERIKLQLQRLGGLRAIDSAITSSMDLHFTLSVFLEQVTQQLGVDAADVLLLNADTQTLEYSAGRGFRTEAPRRTRLRMGECCAGRAAIERRLVEVPDLAATPNGFARSELLASEEFRAYFAAPLVAHGQVKGVFEVFHRGLLDPDEEWRNYLQTLAGQGAIALDSMTLFQNLQRSNVELGLAYETTLEGWSRALELRDRETQGHTMRVTELTMRLARAVGMDEQALTHVRRGALLHDIGKMGIPDGILLKPGPLSEEEWAVMRKHAEFALTLLWPVTYLRPALDIPYCHHERWDGSGYPRGLKGEEIPLAARVFAVVDNWDALSFDRPYRDAWPRERVLAYLQEKAGTLFDPAIVAAFVRLVGD